MGVKAQVISLMSPQRNITGRLLLLGVDGGGTKTRAVVTDARQNVLGEGLAGPSNPLRVGIRKAAANVRAAIKQACRAAGIQISQVKAAEIGLAGVRQQELRERMRRELNDLGLSALEIVTDAETALFSATGGRAGLVIIAGTGSICCGVNMQGQHECAGGWGPLAGDEGSGSWIARAALQAVARASDGRGPDTVLSAAACRFFGVTTADAVMSEINQPTLTNDRMAAFARYVIEAAQDGDQVARAILAEAGRVLGVAAATVIRKLRMRGEKFPIGYVGGVFAAGELLLTSLRAEISKAAPEAYLVMPQMNPAVAAARMAQENFALPREFALAG